MPRVPAKKTQKKHRAIKKIAPQPSRIVLDTLPEGWEQDLQNQLEKVVEPKND